MTKELEALDYVWYNYYTEELDREEVEQIEKNLNIVQDGLKRLEQIENASPSEALDKLKTLGHICVYRDTWTPFEIHFEEEFTTIKQALIKAQEMKEESYVIYCINNYHNVYMDYRGEPGIYQEATIFNDKLEAHKFLREKGNNNDYYRWSVFNVKDLSEDQKHRQE